MKVFNSTLGRFNAYLLTVTILFTSLAYAFPAQAEAPQTPTPPQEILTKRTKYSKTFKNPTGSYTAKISLTPIHYKTTNGNYEEIDNTLIPSTAGYAYENNENSFKAKFKESAKDPLSLLIEKDGYKIELGLASSNNNALKNFDDDATVSKNKITYRSTNEKFSIKQHVGPERVKEEIVLNEKPLTNKFIYELKAPGLTAVKQDGGSVLLNDTNGKNIVSIPPVFMYEEKAPPEKAVVLDLTLTKQDSFYVLTYTDIGNWLQEEKRAYPVIVDPSVVTIDGSSGGADTIIRNGSNPYPYYNYGAHSKLLITKDATYERRSILRFPDPKDFGIPNDALIASASLNLRSVYWSDAAEVSVHRLLRPWKEGSGNPSATNSVSVDGATWLERRYGDNQNNGNSPFNESDPDWTTSGGDYNPAVEDTQSFATADRMDWDFYWIYDITKVFRQWSVGDVENHGLLLKALNVGDTVTFHSKEDGTYEPYIEVTYEESYRWGIGASWTYQDVAVGGGVNASVNVDNGNLVVSKPLQTLPGRGTPLAFQPTYNSLDKDILIEGLPMGHLWNPGLALSLTEDNGNVVVKERNGLEHNFFQNSSGTFVHSATENGTLSYSATADEYIYRQADGTKHVFDASSSNRIDYIVDVKGNTTSYNYDWLTGRLETITDPSGRNYSISWADGLIDEITDPTGRKNKFSYVDYYEDGWRWPGPTKWTLVSSIVEAYGTSEARTVSFGYQGKNLVSITDPRGVTTGFTYGTIWGYDGMVKTINHPGIVPDTNMNYRSQGATTSYTDIKHLSLTTEYQLDAYSGNVHALTQSPNADPLIQQSEYATGNDLLEESELRAPTEAMVSSSFDYEPSDDGNPSDNLIEEELPGNGNAQTSSYAYASDTDTGARDNITQEKYSSGLEENTEYDAESNPTEENENVLDGSSIDTGNTYDSYGNQLKGSLNINRNFNVLGNPDMEIPGSNYRPKYWDQTDSTDNIEGSTTVTRSGTYKRAGDYSLRIYRTTSSISTYSRVRLCP